MSPLLKTLSKFSSLVSQTLMGKRRHPRKRSFNLVKLINSYHHKKASATSLRSVSNIIDISEGGLQFLSREKFEPDTVLSLMINLAEMNIQIPVDAKIVWIKKVKKRGAYRYGAAFLCIDSSDRKLIGDLTKHPRVKVSVQKK